MTPDAKRRLKKMYLSGAPWRDIENEFDRSMISLSQVIRKMGLPRRNRYQTQWTMAGGYMRPWLFQRDELERLYEHGHYLEEIASRLGRTADGVRQELRKMGLITPSGAESICALVEDWFASSAAVPMIKVFDDAGIKSKDIAESLEVEPKILSRWRKRHAAPRPVNRKEGRRGASARRDARSRMLPGYYDEHA